MAKKSITKAVKDFWYGKPHSAEEGGRRLGELYEDKTGLLKHREWRGVKDTFYYTSVWICASSMTSGLPSSTVLSMTVTSCWCCAEARSMISVAFLLKV